MSVSASALIAAVHRRRPLWDPQDVHYHNRVVLNGLWQEVGAEFGLNLVTVKSKWRGLRDYYKQLRRHIDSAENSNYHSSWAHYEEMSFLECSIPPKRSIVPEPVVKEEPSPPPLNENEIVDHQWEKVWVDPILPANQTQPKYSGSESSEEDDDDLHFFKSLLPDVRSLSRPKKAFIRLRIQELIFKEVYGGEQIDSTREPNLEKDSR